MNRFIALLRGINVGGHQKLPMAELKEVLARLGLSNIKTYIQSGNVVFDSEEGSRSLLAAQIQAAIDQSHGFAPSIMLLTAAEIETAIASNPFPEGAQEPKTLHLYFLSRAAEQPDFPALDQVKKESERYWLADQVFYLHAPDGIGRSKLATKVEKALGVAVTARNWRTVNKIREML